MITILRKWMGSVFSFWALLFGGAISSLIFPPFEGRWYGYTALVLFLSYMFSFKEVNKKVFYKAYIFGFSFFVVGFYWICNALLIDGDAFIGFVPVVILAIGLFFGLFIAIPAYFMKWGKNIYARVLIFCISMVGGICRILSVDLSV